MNDNIILPTTTLLNHTTTVAITTMDHDNDDHHHPSVTNHNDHQLQQQSQQQYRRRRNTEQPNVVVVDKTKSKHYDSNQSHSGMVISPFSVPMITLIQQPTPSMIKCSKQRRRRRHRRSILLLYTSSMFLFLSIISILQSMNTYHVMMMTRDPTTATTTKSTSTTTTTLTTTYHQHHHDNDNYYSQWHIEQYHPLSSYSKLSSQQHTVVVSDISEQQQEPSATLEQQSSSSSISISPQQRRYLRKMDSSYYHYHPNNNNNNNDNPISFSSTVSLWIQSLNHTIQRWYHNNHHSTSSTTTSIDHPKLTNSNPKQNVLPKKRLHYITFGSSITFHGDDSNGTSTTTTKSYPYLLHDDPHVQSVAFPTGIVYADYAAACTQSIIDGSNSNSNLQPYDTLSTTTRKQSIVSPPDVITIEYYMNQHQNDISHGHEILIQRLRNRYPSTIIVILQIIDPYQHVVLLKQQIKQRRSYHHHTNDTTITQNNSNNSHIVEATTATTTPSIIMNFQQWKQLQQQQQQQSDHTTTTATSATFKQQQQLSYDMIQYATQLTQQEEQNNTNTNNNERYEFYWSIVSSTTTTNNHLNHNRLHTMLQSDPYMVQYQLCDTGILQNEQHIQQVLQNYNIQYLLLSDDDTISSSSVSLLSSIGHETIAKGIQQVIQPYFEQQQQPTMTNNQDQTTTSTTTTNSKSMFHRRTNNHNNHHHNPNLYQYPNPKHDYTNDWGSGDDCHVWYTSGEYHTTMDQMGGGNPVNIPFLVSSDEIEQRSLVTTTTTTKPWNMVYNFFHTIWDKTVSSLSSSTKPHKHALEYTKVSSSSTTITLNSSNLLSPILGTTDSSSSSKQLNSIPVYNPFPTERLLSITYLTDTDGMSYPKTRIVINDIPTVVIQPTYETIPSNTHYNMNNDEQQLVQYHVTRTSHVGYIPPGKSIIQFLPMQTTELPFRLVGVSILANEVHDLVSIEYSLETDMIPSIVT